MKVIVGILLILSISIQPGWAEESDGEFPRSMSQLQRDIASGKILKVKGVYLGMPIDEATEVLNEQLGTNYNVAEHNYNEVGFMVMGTYYQLGMPVAKYPIFIADKSGKVIMITFGGDLLDALFNVKGIPMEDFVQTFVNSYPIPTMEGFYENGMSGWQYVSPYGWKVQIDAQRALMMKTVPSKKEMKFD